MIKPSFAGEAVCTVPAHAASTFHRQRAGLAAIGPSIGSAQAQPCISVSVGSVAKLKGGSACRR